MGVTATLPASDQRAALRDEREFGRGTRALLVLVVAVLAAGLSPGIAKKKNPPFGCPAFVCTADPISQIAAVRRHQDKEIGEGRPAT